jgi:tetratricopeptide (TPR) repeat protein
MSSFTSENGEAVVVGSRPGSVWENLAASYMRLGRFVEAESAYELALELEPENQVFRDGITKVKIARAAAEEVASGVEESKGDELDSPENSVLEASVADDEGPQKVPGAKEVFPALSPEMQAFINSGVLQLSNGGTRKLRYFS